MKLRELEKIDYKDTRTNQKHPVRTPAPIKSRGMKPGKASNAATADQKRTMSGRVTKTSVVSPKQGPGRPLKRPSKRGRGRPPKNGSSATSASASRAAPKTPSRRSVKREYEPASPIVKIDKKEPLKASSFHRGENNGEHHTSLMHKFFRAHEDEVAHIPKKKQRKALGKMWRVSPLNPKNARAEKESGPGSESDEAASKDEHSEDDLDKEEATEAAEEAMDEKYAKLPEQKNSENAEQKVDVDDDLSF